MSNNSDIIDDNPLGPNSDLNQIISCIVSLKNDLDKLKTMDDIRSVYSRYMRGFDRNDIDLLRSAFWEDVQINYGIQSNSLDQFIERHLLKHPELFHSWGHVLSNEYIEVDGDVAHVEIYVTGFFRCRDSGNGQAEMRITSGRYIDRLARREGQWRIVVREYIPHFGSDKYEETLKFYENDGEIISPGRYASWDRNDVSYRRPLVARS